jgi:hypothetical protein
MSPGVQIIHTPKRDTATAYTFEVWNGEKVYRCQVTHTMARQGAARRPGETPIDHARELAGILAAEKWARTEAPTS